jgi:uncharacterized protein (DUF433 family)
MQVELESYFDFVSPEDIRIKDTRIGIEFVLRDYQGGASPEEIVLRYPTLSLEQVHATITYYLHHRRSVEAYLARWWAQGEAAWEEQQRHPSEFVRDLRERVERQRQELQSGRIPNPVST